MLVIPYFKHLLKAKGPHGVHSPFVFQLITQVLHRKQTRLIWKQIESERRAYLANDTVYQAQDFGAGSRGLGNSRAISRAVAAGAMSKRKGESLHLLLEHLAPSGMIELGTQFGIGSLYLASALPNDAPFLTLEGDATHARYAGELFKRFPFSIELQEGVFEETMVRGLSTYKKITSAFVDGNHTEEATWRYFETLAENPQMRVIIFDDIYWSEGMKRAWERICADERTRLSLDFYWFGVVFLDGRMTKEHFQLYLPR